MPQRTVRDELFEPGEAERKVADIRTLLRKAESLRAAGTEAGASAAESEVQSRLEGILARLTPRFARYARGAFEGAPEETVEDAISEMAFSVCRKIRDLTPTQAHFERRFNQCVKLTIIDAIIKVRRENDCDKDGNPSAGTPPLSLDVPVGASDDGELQLVDTVADPSAQRSLERVLGEQAAEKLLARLPNQRWAQVLADRLAGLPWKEVAAKAGVGLTTAKAYHDSAVSCLRELMVSSEPKEERS